MYHIKKDKRSQKSAALIYEALRCCLKHQAFDQITISDIQKKSFVSRTTFYRHFDTLRDVLYWQCDQRFEEVLMGYCPQPGEEKQDPYHFLRYFLHVWQTHSDILELLYSTGQIDIIYQCHLNHLPNFFKRHTSYHLSSEEYDYFIGIRCGVLLGMILPWVKNHKTQTVDELIALLHRQWEEIAKKQLVL